MKEVEKGWGFERWVVNKPAYCGKLLFFNKDKRCSWHYHKIKDETFYLQSGKIKLLTGWSDDLALATETMLTPGMSHYIPIGLRHQMIALETSELFEFSTEHFDEDSIRVSKGD